MVGVPCFAGMQTNIAGGHIRQAAPAWQPCEYARKHFKTCTLRRKRKKKKPSPAEAKRGLAGAFRYLDAQILDSYPASGAANAAGRAISVDRRPASREPVSTRTSGACATRLRPSALAR